MHKFRHGGEWNCAVWPSKSHEKWGRETEQAFFFFIQTGVLCLESMLIIADLLVSTNKGIAENWQWLGQLPVSPLDVKSTDSPCSESFRDWFQWAITAVSIIGQYINLITMILVPLVYNIIIFTLWFKVATLTSSCRTSLYLTKTNAVLLQDVFLRRILFLCLDKSNYQKHNERFASTAYILTRRSF